MSETVSANRIIDGEKIFQLVDRHGMPVAVINNKLRESGLGFNVVEFIGAARNAGWKDKSIRTALLDDMLTTEARDLISELLP